jgi:hypothetical protein
MRDSLRWESETRAKMGVEIPLADQSLDRIRRRSYIRVGSLSGALGSVHLDLICRSNLDASK